jgi:hypothetical protein
MIDDVKQFPGAYTSSGKLPGKEGDGCEFECSGRVFFSHELPRKCVDCSGNSRIKGFFILWKINEASFTGL